MVTVGEQIAVSTLIAFILLGIEEIGVEIEDPSATTKNDMPLEQFLQVRRERLETHETNSSVLLWVASDKCDLL